MDKRPHGKTYKPHFEIRRETIESMLVKHPEAKAFVVAVDDVEPNEFGIKHIFNFGPEGLVEIEDNP